MNRIKTLVLSVAAIAAASLAVAQDGAGDGFVISASSNHSGGVNVMMMDGSIRFVSDTIDCGNQSAGCRGYPDTSSKSAYGVWGAMVTKAAGETASI